MNDAISVTQFAYKCILEYSLDLLECWLGQTPGRTHRSMIASRGVIIYFRRGPTTPGVNLLQGPVYFMTLHTTISKFHEIMQQQKLCSFFIVQRR